MFCVGYEIYTLEPRSLEYIFHNQHKTLNNLYLLNHTICRISGHYQRYSCVCIVKNMKAVEGSHFRMCDVTQPKLDIHVSEYQSWTPSDKTFWIHVDLLAGQ